MSTARGIILVFLLIVLWDVALYALGKETISEVFALTGGEYPLFKLAVVFSMGVLVGHWFWPMRPQSNNNKGSQ